MSNLKPFDAFFLATETRSAPWHMAGCEVFQMPKNARSDYVDRLIDQMKANSPVEPFNLTLNSSRLWPKWEKSEVDLEYHVSRQRLPEPGSDEQVMAALQNFGSSTLDRNVPLWECCVIDGLSDNRFVLAFKIHHSVIDGQGGLKIILRALSHRKADKQALALWGDNTPAQKSKKGSGKKRGPSSAKNALARLPNFSSLLEPGAIKKWQGRIGDLRLFRARRSALNQNAHSSARRFGIGDLSLSLMSSVAKSNGATINDVLLAAVDEGLSRYFADDNKALPESLIAAMPVSTRKEGQEGGNAAGLLTIELGDSASSPLQRLRQITANTQRAKSHLQELPSSFIMGYGIAILGMPLLLQRLGLGERLPLVNLGVSNVSPPKGSSYLEKPLYLAGAKLLGLYTQPILPPSVLLNVTAASMQGKLCLGIGSTKEAIAEPLRFAGLISQALNDMAEESGLKVA